MYVCVPKTGFEDLAVFGRPSSQARHTPTAIPLRQEIREVQTETQTPQQRRESECSIRISMIERADGYITAVCLLACL